MGTTTKVFIVLNLVIALFMSAAAITLYGKQINWIDQTRQSIEEGNRMYVELKTDNDRLETELKDVRAQLAHEKERATVLASERDTLRKENTLLTNSLQEQDARAKLTDDTITQLRIMTEKKEQRNGELQKMLDEEIRKNSATVKQAEWHQSQAIEIAAELREAENEMMQLAKSNADLVRRVTLLSGQLERYVARYGADPADATSGAEVAINGRVLQVEKDLDLVILSVGGRDKVTAGMEFVISRGDSYISKVRVANVYDDMCSARIVDGMTKGGESIKVSDNASTLN